MVRFALGATALVALTGLTAAQAGAAVLSCPPRHHHHAHMAYRAPVRVVHGRVAYRSAPPVYNYEDNGRYDGADLPPHQVVYGQGPSWLDGYGARSVDYGPGIGSTVEYGGSAQVWPRAILPAGGLAVYSPGAYGPGPRIITIPNDY